MLLFDCAISLLPGCRVPVIACASDDGGVLLYNFQKVDQELSCVKLMMIPGHEDWVRVVTFTTEGLRDVCSVLIDYFIIKNCLKNKTDNGDLLLASASQDTLIRVWRISQKNTETTTPSLIEPALQSNKGEFSVIYKDELKFKCQLETVLQGHENWVYGLHWQSPVSKGKLFQIRNLSFKFIKEL